MISQNILNKFKQYYKDDYGIELSPTQALEECTALFDLLEVVYKPPKSHNMLTFSNKDAKNNNIHT